MAKEIKATKQPKAPKVKSVLTDAEREDVVVTNKYELMFILSPALTEDKREQAVDELTALLEEKGASIFHVDDWGKRRLAYAIKKQEEGYYMIFYFNLSNVSTLPEIEKHLRLEHSFLRHLLLKIDDDYEIKDFTVQEEEPVKPAPKVSKKEQKEAVNSKVENIKSDTEKEI